ncbi:MAG: SEL1-like repeat protein, partial [Geminicoccaceae bacterium]
TKAQTSFAAVVINRQSDLPKDMTRHYEQEAMRWLEVAVKEDDPAAMAALGMVYAEGGLGIEPDLDKAKGLLERAAGLDNTTAKTGLGYLYASGRFGDGNVDQAVPWFEAAAEQNDASAMVSLGALYSKGHGVPKDAGRAIGLYESACAADAGFEDLVAKSVQQMTPYETILGIQTLLTSKGYKPGPSDGIFGRRTADAARLFAKDNRLVVDDSDRPALLLDIMNCK